MIFPTGFYQNAFLKRLIKKYLPQKRFLILGIICILLSHSALQARNFLNVLPHIIPADTSGCDSVPTLTCVQNYTVSLINGVYIRIAAIDLIASVSDNCTSEADLKNSATVTSETATIPDTARTLYLNCNDFVSTAPSHIFYAKIWIKNANGKLNNCIAPVKLPTDIDYGCIDSPRGDPLGGIIKTETSQPVPDVEVKAVLTNGKTAALSKTDINGTFSINSLSLSESYTMSASKANLGGRPSDVTTYDIALVSQHILGIRTLNSPYKIIAADVDNSGEVDAVDLLLMRRYVLGVSASLPAGVWRFVDKAYVFKNPANPLNETFPEFINIAPNFYGNLNFIAIQVGDVNNSYELLQSPNGNIKRQ